MTDAVEKHPGSPFALSNALNGESRSNVLQSDDVLFDKAEVDSHKAIINGQTARPTRNHERQSSRKLDLNGASMPLECDDQRRYVGTVIDGRYKLEAVLGEGASAVVYQGRHQVLNKLVAIKILRPSMARDLAISKRFLVEAKACSLIDHPNVIDVLDFGTLEDGTTYSVIEYLKGETLADAIEHNREIDARRLLRIAWQIADGLEAAHRCNVIHRDLKPENVFMIDKGSHSDFVKILDFGIAKASSLALMQTCAGTVFGTPYYMSPEQAMGSDVDHRSDIYALGVIMYEMASGTVPFMADNVLSVLNQHVNQAPPPLIDCTHPSAVSFGPVLAEFDAMVRKCMSKKPEHRYQSTQQLQDDIKRLEHKLGESTELASVTSSLSERNDELSGADITTAPTCVVADDVTLANSSVQTQAHNEQQQEHVVTANTYDPSVESFVQLGSDAPVVSQTLVQTDEPADGSPPLAASAEPLIALVMQPTTLSAPHDATGDNFRQPAKTPRKVGMWIGLGAAVVAGLIGAIYVATTHGSSRNNGDRSASTNELVHEASENVIAQDAPSIKSNTVDTVASVVPDAFAQGSDADVHEMHEVQVHTIPSAAQVFVGGVPKGLSPVVVRASLAQPVQVTVQRAGYQPQTMEFDGSETRETITLQAVPAPVRTTPVPAKKTTSSQPNSSIKLQPMTTTMPLGTVKNPWGDN